MIAELECGFFQGLVTDRGRQRLDHLVAPVQFPNLSYQRFYGLGDILCLVGLYTWAITTADAFYGFVGDSTYLLRLMAQFIGLRNPKDILKQK